MKDIKSLIMFLISAAYREPEEFLAYTTKERKTRLLCPPIEDLGDLSPESQLMFDRIERDEDLKDLDENFSFDYVEDYISFTRRLYIKFKKYLWFNGNNFEVKDCMLENNDLEIEDIDTLNRDNNTEREKNKTMV